MLKRGLSKIATRLGVFSGRTERASSRPDSMGSRAPPRLEDIELTAAPLPEAFSIEPTGSCNLKCTMCPLTEGTTSSGTAARSLAPALWRALLNETNATVRKIIFVGFGEPMLNPSFGTMLLDADRQGITTGFSTNGGTLPSGFTDLASQLQHLAHINVSIETVNEGVYRDIRGGKAAKALASLEALNAAFGETTTVTASAIVMRSTIASLPDLPPALAAIKVRRLNLQNLHDQSPKGLGEDIGGVAGAGALLDLTLAAAAKNGVAIDFEDEGLLRNKLDRSATSGLVPVTTGPEDSRQCDIAWQMPHIDSLGGVYPCCRASAVSSEKMGDLNDHSLTEIWNGDAFSDFRSRMLNKQGRPCPSLCSTCDAVPAGRPTIGDFAALLVEEGSRIQGRNVRLEVLNIGRETWVGESLPVIGTTRKRDRASAARTPDWLQPNRIVRPLEDEVQPGFIAHYDFRISDASDYAAPEWFQLVIDGRAWLPATSFAIRRMRPKRRFLGKMPPPLVLEFYRAATPVEHIIVGLPS